MDTTAEAYLYAGVRMMADVWPMLWSPVVSAAAGLLGVYTGYRLNLARDRHDRRLQFTKSQLEELYAPLSGIRREIRAKSEFRTTVHEAAASVLDPESNKDDEAFSRLQEYDNRQLREDLIPSYRRMLEVLKGKVHLAEESTLTHYPDLLQFVDTWTRWREKAIPGKVVKRIGHDETKLYPLYDDIDYQTRRLRDALRKGGAA